MLNGVKYSIDYYQREYKWEREQVEELIDDFQTRFFNHYDPCHERTKVQSYPHYFLGSVVISKKDGKNFIIDGQQRLTTLTLLLIYLNNLQNEKKNGIVNIENLIFSEQYGKKSFNLDIQERERCFHSLYKNEEFNSSDSPESIETMLERYSDIEEIFPDELKGDALAYFIDWLTDNVDIVEISADNDDDAYTIFETMNDRGLPLSSTEMLKGYLLANIDDQDEKNHCHEIWKKYLAELKEVDKSEDASDFFKAWLRGKYAKTFRERTRGAANRDFEKIGTSFHKWVRDEKEKAGLNTHRDFSKFIDLDYSFFARQHKKILENTYSFNEKFPYLYYLYSNGFTSIQYPLILSPLNPGDDENTVNTKINLVSAFLDQFIARRIVNSHNFGNSAISYTIFNFTKDIRGLDIDDLSTELTRFTENIDENFDNIGQLYLNKQNRKRIHRLLARITSHIEKECGIPSNYPDYISWELKKPFEIEHIIPDVWERNQDKFESEAEFNEYRNCPGNLVLLTRGFNQSLGCEDFPLKCKNYFGQNLLAKSLNKDCYKNNPTFLSYISDAELSFEPYEIFGKEEIDRRCDLYLEICNQIWSIDVYDKIVEDHEVMQ
ncbi:DUF262 domain-containing protein [Methanogenium sp. MK-MG]|uniref:DUF262 domain-containing protein n=1 Tax=Methanogenium sp. MK-MG TaxID=2599926 RepID=UPI00211048A5|nr:DUF262 domain-containing protein [Methanogenium sp. MK-MG]